MLVTEPSQSSQEFRCRRQDPTLTLNRLQKNGHGLRRDSLGDRIEIVKRYVAESLHGWLESVFHLFLACGTDPGQRATVKTVLKRQNLVTASVFVAELARDFEQ